MPATSRLFSQKKSRRWRKGKTQFIFRNNGTDYALTVNAFVAPVLAIGALALVMSSILAGGYLFLRDDLQANQRQWREKVVMRYEERIAELRKAVDTAVSRQAIIQQSMENRVSRLLEKQRELNMRSDALRGRLKKAGDKRASVAPSADWTNRLAGAVESRTGLRLGSFQPTQNAQQFAAAYNDVFESFEAVLAQSERRQLTALQKAKANAARKTKRLASILKQQGMTVENANAVGGPLIQLKGADPFSETVQALDEQLATLDRVRLAATHLPHGSPVKGKKISSRFGRRKDPFTGRSAMHGGIDFRARTGTPVLATAAGVVTRAYRAGGYGKLVEIDHGGGITTRYAHLHRMKVKKGDRIARGQKIGTVGSTGRSTGPHLHYEVRRKGRVLDPITYVRLEKKMRPYL
ncbi:MAG: M23 family metallopeptidase [Pseudomonadota bacterium]